MKLLHEAGGQNHTAPCPRPRKVFAYRRCGSQSHVLNECSYIQITTEDYGSTKKYGPYPATKLYLWQRGNMSTCDRLVV